MTTDPKTEALKPEIIGYVERNNGIKGPGFAKWKEPVYANTPLETATDTPDRINHDYAQKRIAELEAGAAAMRDALAFTAETLKRIREYITDGQLATDVDLQDLCISNAQKTEGFIRAALASTAGTDFAERLRKAVEERDAAIREREACHNLFDQVLALFGYEKGQSYPGIVGAAEKMKEALAAVTAERDALQHIIDCANTPLMRDVLAERDALRKAIQDAPHASSCHQKIDWDLAPYTPTRPCNCWKASALKGAE